jgi:hypothetical protein
MANADLPGVKRRLFIIVLSHRLCLGFDLIALLGELDITI